ncbi:MAG TPA: phosphoenolpyruvate--protein phosphotransferase [Verrucomicrobiae bacterium]|nr:phosphoenolpyruvate--protein phosphotransferase [Verrucomicrobiae bacterium]
MPLDYSFSCPLPNGVHARPASALEEVARGFAADVVLLNQRTGRSANAKSILSIVGADIRFSDPCLLKISGADEEQAMASIGAFIRNSLPRQETALPIIKAVDGELQLPPCLQNSGAVFRRGTAVAPGIGQGRIVHVGGFRVRQDLPLDGVADVAAEQRLVSDALDELIHWYGQRAAAAGEGIESELFLAHRSLARDTEFRDRILEAVAERGRTAAGAIADAEARFSGVFSKSENTLVRERVLDIRDVCAQLLQRVYGDDASARGVTLVQDSIVVADALTPCQFLFLDCRFLKGLVLGEAGTTSHTVILARSFGVPTLVGVTNVQEERETEAILDGEIGVLVTSLTESARRYYRMERERLDGRQLVLRNSADQPAATRDGYKIEVAANIASVEEAGRALAGGAESIGLFRTEMLFLDHTKPPSEAEQLEVYQRVIEAAEFRPVIIRTLDAGGDKGIEFLKLPAESNPFLGYRAMRIYPQFESLFRTQVRAIIRASAQGTIRLMLPMVSTLEEIQWAKKIIAEEQAHLAAESRALDRKLEIGMMIEVPSVAFALDEFSREMDFFSIGSNDLLQYFMAANRMDSRLAPLYDPLQPAFLRLLEQIVKAAKANGKWIGLCGEMGGQMRYLPVLVGLGLDEISVSVPAIGAVKAEMSRLDVVECRQLFESALKCSAVRDVGALLEQFSAHHALPLLAPELIVVQADAVTKEEAIKRGVDLLYMHGRTEEPRALEAAIWQREATYSTGFGHGFAMPHCKSDAVSANSLVVLKFAQPIPWNSIDAQPVRVMILSAIREGDGATEHLKIMSALARQLMHEEFRFALEGEVDPVALCELLRRRIES